MTSESERAEVSLADAFTREHHEIDAGIEEYLVSQESDPRLRAVPLQKAMEALRRHIFLEEEIVFPRFPPGPLMMPMMVMRREHGEIWRQMDSLAERLGDPRGEAEGVEAVCRELLDLLERHNAKEEPVIYPHLDADLDDDERARVRDLLAVGTLPAGWVCQDA